MALVATKSNCLGSVIIFDSIVFSHNDHTVLWRFGSQVVNGWGRWHVHVEWTCRFDLKGKRWCGADYGMDPHSRWGPLASVPWNYATLAVIRINFRPIASDRVQRGFEILAANVPKTHMQIVSWCGSASMRLSSRPLCPAEFTVRLNNPVNPRFTTSLQRRDLLCGWTSAEPHEIIDVFIEDRVHSGAGILKTFDEITFETVCATHDSSRASGASKVGPLWSWIALW